MAENYPSASWHASNQRSIGQSVAASSTPMAILNHLSRTGSARKPRSAVPKPAQIETLGRFTTAKATEISEHRQERRLRIGVDGHRRHRHHPGFRIDPLEGRGFEEGHRPASSRRPCPASATWRSARRDRADRRRRRSSAPDAATERPSAPRRARSRPRAAATRNPPPMPSMCGMVRPKPKFTPDASSMKLFGPGVTEVTNA